MEGNRDDAVKCLRIGKEALDAGDAGRAIKFLTKAARLDPSLPVSSLLAQAQQQQSSSESSSRQPQDDDDEDAPPPPPRQHKDRAKDKPSSSSAAAPNGGAEATYTKEQVEIVRLIRGKKDFYEILSLDKSTCTVEDVRKAYRKLSLKVHPDKNKAPGAEDAFKAVSKAFQCLSDPEARKRYDLTGSSDDVVHHRRRNHQHPAGGYGYNGFYDDEFDPDEIFRNFFYGGMAPTTTAQFGTFRFRTGGMGGGAGGAQAVHNGSTLRMLIQLLPVLLLLLFNFLPSSEPVYSLSRSYTYDYKLQTARGVPFYVKSAKFEDDYPRQSSDRFALEQRIEREYFGILSQNCRMELQRKQWGFSNETPYCDMLQRFEKVAA